MIQQCNHIHLQKNLFEDIIFPNKRKINSQRRKPFQENYVLSAKYRIYLKVFLKDMYSLIYAIANIMFFIMLNSVQFNSISHVWLFATPQIASCQASLSITNSQNLLKLMSMVLVMWSNHFILCHPLFHLPSIFPCIRVFSNESVLCIRWPKYWSFSFNISPSNEYSGLISFRMDWLDLPAVQRTLKSLVQHYSSRASSLGTQISL